MQITSLNKVISAILVGGVIILTLVIGTRHQVSPIFEEHTQSIGLTLIAGFFLVCTSMLLGAMAEGLTDITVRRFLKNALRREWVAVIFQKSSEFHSMKLWLDDFLQTMDREPTYREFLACFTGRSHAEYPLSESNIPKGCELVCVGIFAKEAPTSEVEWVQDHYAYFVLLSNLIIFGPLLIYCSFESFLMEDTLVHVDLFWMDFELWIEKDLVTSLALSGALISAYLIGIHAVDKLLYTYHATYRFCSLWARDRAETARSSAETDCSADLFAAFWKIARCTLGRQSRNTGKSTAQS